MKHSTALLSDFVDPAWSAERSVVLRYRDVCAAGDGGGAYRTWLERTSIREGARIVTLMRYGGVDVYVLDETSLMHTASLKSIDGCVTTARCKLKGYDAIVFESGGNTGAALTTYATRVGLETFCFVPEDNVTLLDSAAFASPHAHLIAVEDPAAVKSAARAFAREHGLPHVPRKEWRYEASMFRGCFIAEYMRAHGRFDWIVQSISAAFGPIGIYRILEAFAGGWGGLPRLLGVQQAENCPIYRAWKGIPDAADPATPRPTRQLLTRVMYDAAPLTYGTYEELRGLLVRIDGDLVTVERGEFETFWRSPEHGLAMRDGLRRHAIDIPEPIADATGLMALAGTVKAIDEGTVTRGSRVLCCLTSGTNRPDGLAQPDGRIPASRPRG